MPLRARRSLAAYALIAAVIGIPSLGLMFMAPETARAADNACAKDIDFALAELEKECGHFFALKKIDWQAVGQEMKAEARKVRSDEEHLALLIRLLARLRDGHAAVKKLEGGRKVRWPNEGRQWIHPGMAWCRSRDAILVKAVDGDAERSGLKPGMEIVEVDGKPVDPWLTARIAELRDRTSFSTDHQAEAYTLNIGLGSFEDRKMTVTVEEPDKNRKIRKSVSLSATSAVRFGPAFLPQDLDRTGDLAYGTLPKGWGYVHLGRCPSDLPEQMDEVLKALGTVPGLILDFRGNRGGGFDHDALLGRFVPKGKELRFAKRYASAGEHPYGGPIVVIVDATVVSAGETAAGMFKEDGRAYMIGESPTAGMSSSKKTIELPSGMFALYVSVYSNKKRFQDGRGIEGIGIEPHEIVPYEAKDLAQGVDTLTRRAEEILGRFPQKSVPYDPKDFDWRPSKPSRQD